MFARLFGKRPKKLKIQRLDREPYEIEGELLSENSFEYEGGTAKANLFRLVDDEVAMEFMFSDSEEYLHVLLKFDSPKEASECIEWMRKDIRQTKAKLQSLLQ